jgi:hypothetical protein
LLRTKPWCLYFAGHRAMRCTHVQAGMRLHYTKRCASTRDSQSIFREGMYNG